MHASRINDLIEKGTDKAENKSVAEGTVYQIKANKSRIHHSAENDLQTAHHSLQSEKVSKVLLHRQKKRFFKYFAKNDLVAMVRNSSIKKIPEATLSRISSVVTDIF